MRFSGASCELCAEALGAAHAHVLDLVEEKLLCACRACALPFLGNVAGRHRGVPEQVRFDPDLQTTEADWAAVGMPVSFAFCFYPSTLARWVAFFPSSGGASEADLSSEAWSELRSRSALLRGIAADVEALLVRRHRDGSIECFVVPIDLCYRLVATIRQLWRGQDGGELVRREINLMFAQLRQRAAALDTTQSPTFRTG
jgi:hypothetical protein